MALDVLTAAGLRDLAPEPIPHPSTYAAPWKEPATNITFHEVPGTSKTDDPIVRRAKALDFLGRLAEEGPPDIQAWTDGAAKVGLLDGGGGYVILWPTPEPPTRGAVAAGALTNSTTSEATAVAAALQRLLEELITEPRTLRVWVLFDSRALLDRLRLPARPPPDQATDNAVRRLDLLGRSHLVSVIWVPGHAGLQWNEEADAMARQGTLLPQDSPNLPYGPLKTAVRRHVEVAWRERYNEGVPLDNLHRRISGGELLPATTSARQADVAILRLRANRAPYLRSTLHRWGREESPACPHCDAGVEDTEHFILECPHWVDQRRRHLGEDVTITCLQDNIRGVIRFLEEAGVLRA